MIASSSVGRLKGGALSSTRRVADSLVLLLLAIVVFALLVWLASSKPTPLTVRRRALTPEAARHGFNRKKPEWVPRALVRLKALMPHASCRHIEKAFNARFAHKGETVGKSYVAQTVKRRAVAILGLRRKLKNRATRQGPRNLTWAADLTFFPDSPHPALGVIDHGTRASLMLKEVRTRTTIALLRAVFDLVERFGRPTSLRTDNEPAFASPLFSLALRAVGIRHQRTDPYSPWQNGRIERLFGTFKERLLLWWQEAGAPGEIQGDLDTVRLWYNHVRPHQGLAGLTPAVAWAGRAGTKPLRFFSAWNGILGGFGRPT